jgi:RimJ/RimL family protein N-acetyltransferase
MSTSSPRRPSELSGLWVQLVPVRPGNIPFLYNLAMDKQNNFRWKYHGAIVSMQEFERQLWSGILSQFVVVTTKNEKPIGHVVAYAADLHLGHVFLGGVFVPEVHGKGLSHEAFRIFMQYLQRNFRLRKCYFEFPSYNAAQYPGSFRDLTEEACLKDHLYYDGRYWDMLIFSTPLGRTYEGDQRASEETRARDHAQPANGLPRGLG